MRATYLLSLSLLLTVFSCADDPPLDGPPTSFSNLPEEQGFTIDPTRDTVLLTKSGVRIFFPAESLVRRNEQPAQGLVDISFVEAVSMADRMAMGAATSVSAGEGLGAFRLLANEGERPLRVNSDNPLVIQFPAASGFDEDVTLLPGTVNSRGKIEWGSGQSPEKYLIPVPFDQLNFHPDLLREELMAAIPFGTFTQGGGALADSFYFSFGGGYMMDLTLGYHGTNWNEAYYQTWHEVAGGAYTFESYAIESYGHSSVEDIIESHGEGTIDVVICGIEPAAIAVLKSEDYAATFIATPAFARRLQILMDIGDEDLLRLYADNLDRNLSEVDRLVFDRLDAQGDARAASFAQFSAQGLTNTKNGARFAESLRAAFDHRKEEFTTQLAGKRQAIQEALQQENQEVEQLIADYQQLLWQRERDRMEAYTFKWTELGWMWPHRNPGPKATRVDTVSMRKLTVDVQNTRSMDEVYVYTVFPAVHSLYRLNASGGGHFYVGFRGEERMYMLEDRGAVVYGVGFKDGDYFLDSISYNTDIDNELSLQLRPVSKGTFERVIGRYDSYGVHNQIRKDLEFQRRLAEEKQRQEEVRQVQIALERMYVRAFPSCYPLDEQAAQQLFEEECTACHSIKTNLTGPALAGVPKRRTISWFIAFTRNSQAMISAGELQASQLWAEWGPTVMTNFEELSDQELVNLYFYIDQYE